MLAILFLIFILLQYILYFSFKSINIYLKYVKDLTWHDLTK